VVDAAEYFYHTPAILCKELETYEGAIDYIKRETGEGRMLPILHGWEHLDYRNVPRRELEFALGSSVYWFEQELGMSPGIWATPWGATSADMIDVAKSLDLSVETTADPVIDQKKAHEAVMSSGTIDCLEGKVVMVHWWELGTRLARICYTGKYGSWEEAAKAVPEYFK
jgi:peptidoglycan/xylan/chitin deacetylase (PgdA/CDA1 family)